MNSAAIMSQFITIPENLNFTKIKLVTSILENNITIGMYV